MRKETRALGIFAQGYYQLMCWGVGDDNRPCES